MPASRNESGGSCGARWRRARTVRDGCTVDAMMPGDSEATLGEPIEIDPVTALETTARETVDEAASYIAAAIEAEDAAHAKALYALAAGVLKTAATAVAELRKEAARQG